MFQKLASEMEKMLYMRVSPQAALYAKRASKLGAVAALSAVASYTKDALPSIPAAFADTGVNFPNTCSPGSLHDAQLAVKGFVNIVNQHAKDYITGSGGESYDTLNELGKYLSTTLSSNFEIINKASHHIIDTCHQSLNNLPKLDPVVYRALELYNLKPEQVPIFGSAELDLIVGGSIAGSIALMTLGKKFYKNVFHDFGK